MNIDFKLNCRSAKSSLVHILQKEHLKPGPFHTLCGRKLTTGFYKIDIENYPYFKRCPKCLQKFKEEK